MEQKIHAPIRILILEDSDSDANLIVRELKNSTLNFEIKTNNRKEAYLQSLMEFIPDIIISDYNIPGFDGLECLTVAHSFDPSIPFLYVSGTMGEDKAVEAILSGARDCINKSNLKRLLPAIERELEQTRMQKHNMQEHEALKLFNRIFVDSFEPTAIFSSDGKLLHFNKAYRKLQEVLNFPVNEILEIPDKQSFQKMADKNGFYCLEKEYLSEKKEIRIVSLTLYSVYDEIKRDIHYVVVKHDITEKKLHEGNLILAKQKAEESDKLKSAFIANISHQISSPLNTIIGFTGLLATSSDKEKQNEFISIIQTSSEQLLRIMEDIIEISKLDAGQVTVKQESVNLNLLMDEIYDYYAFYLGQQKQHVQLIHSKGEKDENAIVYCDPLHVRQILNYLINNAYKFTNQGEISFGYRFDNRNLVFFVSDTGIGIEESAHEIIFDRFRQANDFIASSYGGSGLGLSISKSLVDLMGGKIWLKSSPGQGAEFYFSLPLKHNNISDGEVDIDKIQHSLKGKTVLIAEDDLMNFYLFREYLTETNCNFIHARDGKEVLALLKENKVDLVFMDIRMPVLNGIESFKQLREMKYTMPVIALTSFSMDNDEEKILALGFNGYIAKPITKKGLMRKISKIIF